MNLYQSIIDKEKKNILENIQTSHIYHEPQKPTKSFIFIISNKFSILESDGVLLAELL